MSDIPNLRHGMSEPHETERFWLMPGDVPTGPFTVPEVHDQLTRGTIAWQTKACRMDEGVWRPLIQTPGIGQVPKQLPVSSIPIQSVHEIEPTVPTPTQPVPANSQNNGQSTPWETLLGVGILALLIVIVVLAVYGIYEWVRPLRPMEVCQRMNEAKTLAEMKIYATVRTYPMLETLAADQTPSDPNDTFELTSEVDGSFPETKHVGFRGSFLFPEWGERVKMEGYFKLIRQDGWKVDDMFVSYVEGATLPKPISLVDEYQKSKEPPKPTNNWNPTPSKTRSTQIKLTPIPKQPAANVDFFTKNNRLIAILIGALLLGWGNHIRTNRSK